jgi:hypothetical protein
MNINGLGGYLASIGFPPIAMCVLSPFKYIYVYFNMSLPHCLSITKYIPLP